MLIDVGMYVSIFETELIAASDLFYAAEGETLTTALIDGASVASYLLHVESRLSFERALCTPGTGGYLRQGTKKGLVGCLERQLVKKHVAVILQKGFSDLVKDNRIEDLSRLFGLFSQVGAVEEIKSYFAEYIEVCITLVVKQLNKFNVVSFS